MSRPPNPISFSTVACPGWDLPRVIAAATEWGYDGVELRTFGAGSTRLASDPALSDPDKTRHAFAQAGLKISCLATSVAVHFKSESEAAAALDAGKSFLDLAARLGCGCIRVFGNQFYPGEQRYTAVRRIADRYSRLAEYSEDLGVEILIENAGSFQRAKELWQLLNYAQQPLIGVCWNVAYAATVGEGPGVSVPMLHTHIRYAKIKDTVVGEGSGYVPIGTGTVECERFVELLRGVAFEGWLCVEWDKLWLPGLAEPEEVLPAARTTLIEWMREKLDKKGKPLSKLEAKVSEVKAADAVPAAAKEAPKAPAPAAPATTATAAKD